MSGARPLLRSPKFGEGITSEAIEESGVNVFMFALSRGTGSARWRFESTLSEVSDMGHFKNWLASNKYRIECHYPFMAALAQSHDRPLSRFCPRCVPDASLPGESPRRESSPASKWCNAINAFLTL